MSVQPPSGILRDMAVAEHEPLFADLAEWVAAGGDPNYAMNYALTQQKSAAAESNLSQPRLVDPRPSTLSHPECDRRERTQAD